MGKNPEITSEDYLSLSGVESQGVKQLMAGGGIVLIGIKLAPPLANALN